MSSRIVIRHWKTRTRLNYRECRFRSECRVVIYNDAGNIMFYGTKVLFDACVQRGHFEFEEV